MMRCYFWVLEISLYQVIKKQGYDEGGDSPVPLYRPFAESDDDVVPFRELSHLGGAEGRG
jgi:hypothetical protein